MNEISTSFSSSSLSIILHRYDTTSYLQITKTPFTRADVSTTEYGSVAFSLAGACVSGASVSAGGQEPVVEVEPVVLEPVLQLLPVVLEPMLQLEPAEPVVLEVAGELGKYTLT